MTQQPLIGRRPRRGGALWASVLDGDGNVVDGAWTHARETRQHVGTCPPPCGQPLKAGRDYTVGPVTWYPAECIACGHETAGHGPRPATSKNGRP